MPLAAPRVKCRSEVTGLRSSLIALAMHFARFDNHEKAMALMQLAGATEALLCDKTLWQRFLAREVDKQLPMLDGSRKLSCSGQHTANLVPFVESMGWLLDEDDEKWTYASFSQFALACEQLGLATLSKGNIKLDGGDTLAYINEAFVFLHGPPVQSYVPALEWDFASLMTAFVTLGLGTKEARDLIDLIKLIIMNCRTGRSSLDALVHDEYIKGLFEALWKFSRHIKEPTAALVEAGRAVRALEGASATVEAIVDGTVARFAELPCGDGAVTVAAALKPVASLLGADALIGVVSAERARALVVAALPARRDAFTQARRLARTACLGEDVDPGNLYDLPGNERTGGGRHVQECRDAVDYVKDANRQRIEINGVKVQGEFRAALARRFHDGEELVVVIAPNHVRYEPWSKAERLVSPFRVMVRRTDVFRGWGGHTAFPSDRSVFFTEFAFAVVLLKLLVASEIAGRPVDFEEAGINIASVLTELVAFFFYKRKQWIIISAVGRQLGILNKDGTVTWDVNAAGQRCEGSIYFRNKPPSDAEVPSLRSVTEIVCDDAITAMIDGGETVEEAWRAVVDQGYKDPEKGKRLWAECDEFYASAAADALLLASGAFLKPGGREPVVVAFAGTCTGDPAKKQWHTNTFEDCAQTIAAGGGKFFSGSTNITNAAYDIVVLAPGFHCKLRTEVTETNRALHLGFIEVASTLHENGLEDAATNADLRQHWAAYYDTKKIHKYPKTKIFKPRDPPSEPLPESLREEYGPHFASWAAEREEVQRAAHALIVSSAQHKPAKRT